MSLTRRCRPNLIRSPKPLKWNPSEQKSVTKIDNPELFKEAMKLCFKTAEKDTHLSQKDSGKWTVANGMIVELDGKNLMIESKSSASTQKNEEWKKLQSLYSVLLVKENLKNMGYQIEENVSGITAKKIEDEKEMIVEVKIESNNELFFESKNFNSESECKKIIDDITEPIEMIETTDNYTSNIAPRQNNRSRDGKEERNIQYQYRSKQRNQDKLHR